MLSSLWFDEEGLTSVEYALLLAMVAVAAIAAWTALGQQTPSTTTSPAPSK